MTSKTVQMILPIIATLMIASTVLGYQSLLNNGKLGEIVTSTWAVETGTLEKDVGQNVCFKAKIKNTGSLNATYIIAANWRETGTDDWETVGHVIISLGPGQYSEIKLLGSVNCTETMKGKYFDAKFILYDAETETVLDQKLTENAWHVRSTLVSGAIAAFWIE